MANTLSQKYKQRKVEQQRESCRINTCNGFPATLSGERVYLHVSLSDHCSVAATCSQFVARSLARWLRRLRRRVGEAWSSVHSEANCVRVAVIKTPPPPLLQLLSANVVSDEIRACARIALRRSASEAAAVHRELGERGRGCRWGGEGRDRCSA